MFGIFIIVIHAGYDVTGNKLILKILKFAENKDQKLLQRIITQKELSLCHKFKFSNFNIVATVCLHAVSKLE